MCRRKDVATWKDGLYGRPEVGCMDYVRWVSLDFKVEAIDANGMQPRQLQNNLNALFELTKR